MTSISDATPDEYIGEDALAKRYHIPPRTAQRWRLTGEGPSYIRLGRRRIVYRIADVEHWLARRTFASHADEMSHRAADAR